MKRLMILLLALLALVTSACAEENSAFVTTGQVRDDLPLLTVTVADTGEQHEEMLRQNVLQVSVEAQDGSFAQQFIYQSSELPQLDRAVPMARLEDLNFDGFNDLVLLTAQGARNVFTALSLWDEEAGQFRPVEQNHVWETERKALSLESSQLELCNYELLPEEKLLYSAVADGYRFLTSTAYRWDGRYGLSIKAVADVYDASPGLIGETVVLYATGITRCWDEHYPETWYCEQEGVWSERHNAIREILLGRASWDATHMQVANVDWVNLRKQDSKASPSLAKLDAGTEVVFLSDGIGQDKGWVRVWYRQDDVPGLTGYIWHSYLEAVDSNAKENKP